MELIRTGGPLAILYTILSKKKMVSLSRLPFRFGSFGGSDILILS